MSLHVRNTQSNKFGVFTQLFPNFCSDDSVLDFGGNRGNLLYFSAGKIKQTRYTSIDVDQTALLTGSQEFPAATWIHYNKFNCMYNHAGNTHESLPALHDIDYIWAYSVFTHTDYTELENAVKWFYTTGFKKAAISVLDINNPVVTNYFYDKRLAEYGSCVDLCSYRSNDVVYLENNSRVIVDQLKLDPIVGSHLATFYNIQWLEQKLKPVCNSIRILYLTENFSPFIILE